MKVTTSQILPRERVIALGTFDGVHLGHQAVLEVASVIAMCEKMAPCALSFLNHPLSVVGAGAPPLLTLPAEKGAAGFPQPDRRADPAAVHPPPVRAGAGGVHPRSCGPRRRAAHRRGR